jgi:hypothetical protein
MEEPVPLASGLLFPANRLLASLMERVRKQGGAATGARLNLMLEEAAPESLEVALARPVTDQTSLLELLRLHLERRRLRAPAVGLTVQLLGVCPARAEQGELFDESLAAAGTLEVTLARLAPALGPDGCHTYACRSAHFPEDRLESHPAPPFPRRSHGGSTGNGGGKGHPDETPLYTGEEDRLGGPISLTDPVTLSPASGLALRFLKPAQLLRTWGRAGRSDTDPPRPQSLAFAGRQRRSCSWIGPFRYASAWWQGGDVERDYFVTELDAGEQLLLFFDRRQGSWFLAGVYD